MTSTFAITAVVWTASTKRRARQAERACRDYDLVPLGHGLYLGRLTRQERREVQRRLTAVLSSGRDHHYLLPLSRSVEAATGTRGSLP